MGVEISIIYVCILIQELCLDCFKKSVFSQLKDVTNFQLDKRLIKVETAISKKASTLSKCNKNDNKIIIKVE